MRPLHLTLAPLALTAVVLWSGPALSQTLDQLFQQGNAAQDSGQYAAAEQIFRQVIRRGPQSAEAYNNRGYALQLQGQLELEIASHQTAIRLDPNNTRAQADLREAQRLMDLRKSSPTGG